MTTSSSPLSPGAVEAAEIVRHHPRREVLPELLVKKLEIERWQAVSLLKELADSGYGDFILGRKGGKTRLEKAETLPHQITQPASRTSKESFNGELEHQVFLLRRSPPVQIKVPADLTREEAERLGKWLILISDVSV